MSESENQLIFPDPNSKAITLWQPQRALPVIGAAVVIWMSRRLFKLAQKQPIQLAEDRAFSSEGDEALQSQSDSYKKPVCRVTYRAYAEWTIHHDG